MNGDIHNIITLFHYTVWSDFWGWWCLNSLSDDLGLQGCYAVTQSSRSTLKEHGAIIFNSYEDQSVLNS